VFGFAHDIATVAAICKAGGLGVYGATRRFRHEIREGLAEIRRRVGERLFGVDLVLPPGMPEHDSHDAIKGHIPHGHRGFVRHIVENYVVPEPSGPGMRTRLIRSTEIEAEQLDRVGGRLLDDDTRAEGSHLDADTGDGVLGDEASRFQHAGRLARIVGLEDQREHALAAGGELSRYG